MVSELFIHLGGVSYRGKTILAVGLTQKAEREKKAAEERAEEERLKNILLEKLAEELPKIWIVVKSGPENKQAKSFCSFVRICGSC